MPNLLQRVVRGRRQERASSDWWASQVLSQLSFAGAQYGTVTSWERDGQEPIDTNFESFARAGHGTNAVVFACVATRMLVFSEARFLWRRFQDGRPADLFADGELGVLERPWANGTTGELLGRMEQDVSLSGNSFWVRRGDRLTRLRPDWVTVLFGSQTGDELDAEILGYLYSPPGKDGRWLDAADVVHYSPIPDPIARWRGMSWITPVIREIQGDKAMTDHKLKFFEHAATPNLVVRFDPQITANQIEEFQQLIEGDHAGWENAWRTLYLGGGADATVVGSTMEQMSFKTTQGAGETRIAAAAGVPPVLVGLSEGLEASTYSNYAQARRRFADGTVRPLWRIASASLESVLSAPAGSRLWYDDHDVAFLREDARDAAEIAGVQSRTVRTLLDAGFEPDAAVAAASTGDMRALTGTHSGMFSVQLQPPNEEVSE